MIKNNKIVPIIFVKILLLSIAVILLTNTACRDPGDFKPDVDTLLFPPPAPQLLTPPDSYAYITGKDELYFQLNWSAVDSAEVYELELSIVGHSATVILDSASFLGLIDKYHFGINLWCVRASSPRWKGGYTDWSEFRIFYTSSRLK